MAQCAFLSADAETNDICTSPAEILGSATSDAGSLREFYNVIMFVLISTGLILDLFISYTSSIWLLNIKL